jgi:hypothetical protein
MPSGPTDWHEEWTKEGPTESGDYNAINYLESLGFKLSKEWEWSHKEYKSWQEIPFKKAQYAINYLIAEWDFGGLN